MGEVEEKISLFASRTLLLLVATEPQIKIISLHILIISILNVLSIQNIPLRLSAEHKKV